MSRKYHDVYGTVDGFDQCMKLAKKIPSCKIPNIITEDDAKKNIFDLANNIQLYSEKYMAKEKRETIYLYTPKCGRDTIIKFSEKSGRFFDFNADEYHICSMCSSIYKNILEIIMGKKICPECMSYLIGSLSENEINVALNACKNAEDLCANKKKDKTEMTM